MQDLSDYGRVKYLQAELTNISAKLSVPLSLCSSIVIPNVTPQKKSSICTVLHKVVKSTSMKAWEKQATKKMVRVVRSSPNTLQAVFEKYSQQQDLSAVRPVCMCTQHMLPCTASGAVFDGRAGLLCASSGQIWVGHGQCWCRGGGGIEVCR